MIDLHMHSTYSDGSESCTSILKKCQEKKLDYISITDHNTALAYEELEKINIKDFYSGKIIPGIELTTKVLHIPIEILGYGIDYKKINTLVNKVYISTKERNLLEFKRLYDKCLNYNIKLDKNFIDNYDYNSFISVFFHNEITKHPENKNLISEEAWNSSKVFYRQYMSDPNTPLYVEMDDLVPDFNTVFDLIKQSGGLVFIPHIFEYKNNAQLILDYILENYNIDGIECYYTTFTEQQTKYLLEICKKKKLYISGGSDFHGSNNPGVDIAIGYGNLNIPTDIIYSWSKQLDL